MVRIIGTETSPFTRKVRIVALERKVPFEFIIDMPLAQTTAVPRFNPLGKVPVLLREDGSTLVDSPLIAQWLETRGEGAPLIPADAAERESVLQWESIADGALDAGVLMRMESLRPESERSPAWVARQLAKVERSLQWLERSLDEREWCVGGTFSLADIAVGCCLAWLEFRFSQHQWRMRCPGLARLCARLEQRPSFVATPMQG